MALLWRIRIVTGFELQEIEITSVYLKIHLRLVEYKAAQPYSTLMKIKIFYLIEHRKVR